MAQFTGDIAGMLELFAIAAGLVLLHRAGKEAPAKLLQAAGWVLVAGGMEPGMMGGGMGSMPHGTTPPTPADGAR